MVGVKSTFQKLTQAGLSPEEGGGMTISNFIEALQETRALLYDVSETFWAGKIDELLRRAGSEVSPYDARRALSWFGGMGSFNDLLISPINGHRLEDGEEDRINHRLSDLREQIYLEARHIADQR